MHLALCPTDLTDGEWALLHPLLPPAKPGGDPEAAMGAQS
jgi:transposase